MIMIGGETIADDNFDDIVADIALLQSLGIRLVLVFGARPQIDGSLAQAGIRSRFHKRIRVTDSDSFRIIKQVCGGLQLEITSRL